MWFFNILFPGILVNAIITNLELIEKQMRLDPFLSLIMLQNILLPIAILLYINMYKISSIVMKVLFSFVAIIISMLVEHLVEKAGVFKYKDWNSWFSFLLWSVVITASIVFYHFVNNQSKREDSHV